jgi:hypothetical protein
VLVYILLVSGGRFSLGACIVSMAKQSVLLLRVSLLGSSQLSAGAVSDACLA